MRWHVLSGEYPPAPGGVADYTQRIAAGLVAAGDAVDVWAPGVTSAVEPSGVVVHGLPDHFGPRARRVLRRALRESTPPHRLLVQYVPHAFGWKGGNVPFCVWLRAQRHAPVWVMFHEVAFPLRRRNRLAENGLGMVTHGMAAIVASAAERAFVSIPAWIPMVHRVAPSTPLEWMPVPSSVEVHRDDEAVRRVRDRFGSSASLIGHFGTFGRLVRPLVDEAIPLVVQAVDGHVLLIGRGSQEAAQEFCRQWPTLAHKVSGTGVLSARALSHHVAACDLMLQPYPDGISSRRTSAMVALAHGRPVVTTVGPLTEPLWRDAPGVTACAVGDAAGLTRACVSQIAMPDPRGLHAAIRAFYTSRFDLTHTIATLRAAPPAFPSRLRQAS